jgi:hypothetical protein
MPQSKEGTFMTEASIIAALLAFMQRQETTEADFNQLACSCSRGNSNTISLTPVSPASAAARR